MLGVSCSSAREGASGAAMPAIVATTPVLGAIVGELVGGAATVDVVMPNGVDPHEWQPSARDVEMLNAADLIVTNGLHLDESLDDALAEATAAGVPVFAAGDHVAHRTADDPHFWLDPLAMRDVVAALAPVVEHELRLDLGGRPAELDQRLEDLDAEVAQTLGVVPAGRRKLVTGHESMGYFADRYSFTLEGAVIPGLSSQAQPSAAELAELKQQIQHADIPVVFAELGNPSQVAEAVAAEAGAAIVELPTHRLPGDGSYFTFMRTIAATIAEALAP